MTHGSPMRTAPLREGYFRVGPEPLGCYNSGAAPCVKRMAESAYAVGYEGDLLFRKSLWMPAYHAGKSGQRRKKAMTGAMYFYRGASSARRAMAKFAALCDARDEENRGERARIDAARAVLADPSALVSAAGFDAAMTISDAGALP